MFAWHFARERELMLANLLASQDAYLGWVVDKFLVFYWLSHELFLKSN